MRRGSCIVHRASWVLLGVLVLTLIGIGIAFRAGEIKQSNNRTIKQSLSSPRHQIYGDPVIVESIEHGKTEAWLTNRVDQLLAWFAQPGKLMCPKGTDLRRAVLEFEREAQGTAGAQDPSRPQSSGNGKGVVKANAVSAERRPYLAIGQGEPREVREMKQIVNGLRSD